MPSCYVARGGSTALWSAEGTLRFCGIFFSREFLEIGLGFLTNMGSWGLRSFLKCGFLLHPRLQQFPLALSSTCVSLGTAFSVALRSQCSRPQDTQWWKLLIFQTLYFSRGWGSWLPNHRNWLETLVGEALSNRRHAIPDSQPESGVQCVSMKGTARLGQESSVLATHQNFKSLWYISKSPWLKPLPPEILIQWGWVGAQWVTHTSSSG